MKVLNVTYNQELGAQFNEEVWKLCFHCNYCLFCFIFEMGKTFQMNRTACMYKNLQSHKSRVCSKENKNSSWQKIVHM